MPGRVSETTVQVSGIDEPDIVKTDGQEIYFSGAVREHWLPGIEERIVPPYYQTGLTRLIKAFPPADMKLDGSIDKAGNLLLSKNMLVIFSEQTFYRSDAAAAVYGYDVSSPRSAQKKWEIKLEKNNSLVAARLYKDKIYAITKKTIDQQQPCPIKILEIGGSPLTIGCADIYHPALSVPSDITFTAMILNPETGKIEKTVSFIGSSGSSVVYMSENAVYITYTYTGNFIKFFSGFIREKGKDLFPVWFLEKMEKLESYDIGQAAKMTEFQAMLEKFLNSLGDDERLKINNELSNRLADYYKEHKRDLEKTGIVKIGLSGFDVDAVGSVPGHPLNQFALDEYQNHLRVAITIGGFWGFGFGAGQADTANDVYVLDQNLKISGAVKDMGLAERIYSVRFIEDKGYAVTFRETDPFYVLDLADPKNPALKGELKIPGYSAYLHPITKDKILGIGKEGW
ncbi:MAG: beta-propeller domain-containing protein, partial [bacterium]|nr:beta-propeller domain-containing protein [bacterium]